MKSQHELMPAATDLVAGQGLRFSVIVPAFNRPGSLRRLLWALASQTYPHERYEVLVCDDGSTEDLVAVVSEVSAETALRIVYLRQPNGGAGSARNLGLANASGELTTFTDSDCIPSPAWLLTLDRAMCESAPTLLGGEVSFLAAEHFAGRCINFLTSTSLGGAGATDPRSLIHMDYYPRTMNMALRRDLALAAGGFLPHRHGEDLEFTHRVRSVAPDLVVKFVPEASVLHNEWRTLRLSFVEQACRGIARIRLARDHGMHEPIHAMPALLVVNMIVVAVVAAWSPVLAAIAAVPLACYAIALLALSVHGTLALRDARALLAVPAHAAAIHLGYGVGYLGGIFGLASRGTAGVATGSPLRVIEPEMRLVFERASGGDWTGPTEPSQIATGSGRDTRTVIGGVAQTQQPSERWPNTSC
jgi:GT2 family glycosyltransferase